MGKTRRQDDDDDVKTGKPRPGFDEPEADLSADEEPKKQSGKRAAAEGGVLREIRKRNELKKEFEAAREAIKKHAEAVRVQGEAIYAKHHQNLEKQLQELERLSGGLEAIGLDNTKAANQVKVFNFERDFKAARAKADELLASIEKEIAAVKPKKIASEPEPKPAVKPAQAAEPTPAPVYADSLEAAAKKTEGEPVGPEAISPENVAKIIAFFDEMAADEEGGGYARMADNLRARAPNGEFESAAVKEQRKKIIDHIFRLNLKDALKHLKFIVEQGSLENMAAVRGAEEADKWEKRRGMMRELLPLLDIKEKGNFSPEIKEKKDALQKLADGLNNDAEILQRKAAKYFDEDAKTSKIYVDKIKALKEGGIREALQTVSNILSDEDFDKTDAAARTRIFALKESLGKIRAEFEEGKIKGSAAKNGQGNKKPPSEPVKIRPVVSVGKSTADATASIGKNEPAPPTGKPPSEPVKIRPVVSVGKLAEDVVKPAEKDEPEIEVEPPHHADIVADLKKIAEEGEKKKQELDGKLAAAREKLKTAFAKKEKSSGFFSRAKARDAANAEFDAAWNEYAAIQQTVVETCRLEAEELRGFLHQESAALQGKLGEYYKGKEHIVSKVWRRLGEMNLYNFLEKKGEEAAAKEKQGEAVGAWDRFWADRSDWLKQRNIVFKLGAKMLSVRLGISMGLLGAGLGGFSYAALPKGIFSGLGTAFGSRHLEDAAQNKVQRWLGNRGEFYGTSEEAETAMREKYRIVEQAFDEDAPMDEKEEKKAARRRAKYEKKLGSVEADMAEFDALPPAEKLSKIQEKISAIEAYAYVNGLDLSKDKNYQRLLAARDRTTEEFLSAQAKEAGDDRPVIRPDDLKDIKALLANRKAELSRTAEKISTEKKLRWGKRIVAATLGVAVGSISYLATLRNAELFQHSQRGPVMAFAKEPAPDLTFAEKPAADLSFAKEPAAGFAVENGQVGFAAELEQLGLTHGAVSKLAEGSFSPEELAEVEKFAVAAGAKHEVMQAYSHALETGHSPEDIYNSMLVHKGDGIERILQRQLQLNPTAYGFKGDLNDVAAVKKWVGHEASVLAQEQGLDDKYFVYKPSEEQMAIISVDEHGKSHVDILGKLYHERPKIAVMETPRAPGNEPVEVRAVYDVKTGGPKFLTDAEQAEFQILTDRGEFDDAMAVVMEAKEHGPVFELPDGQEMHGDALSFSETTPVAETATTTERIGSTDLQDAYTQGLEKGGTNVPADVHPGLNDLQNEYLKSIKENAVPPEAPKTEAHGVSELNQDQKDYLDVVKAGEDKEKAALAEYMAEQQKKALELAEKHHLLSETDALGPEHPEYKTSWVITKFDYGEHGEVKGVGIHLEDRFLGDRAGYEKMLKETYLADANTVFKDEFVKADFDTLAAKAVAHESMINRGLGNTREAQYLFKDIRRDAFELAEESGKSPDELFRWNFKDNYKIKS